MECIERRIPSSDGAHHLYCRVFQPEGEIKGLFHVVHGMQEHIRRYESFMRTMAENGYLCYGFDNLGHGYTVNDDSELGYIGGWQLLVDDVRNVSKLMKEEYDPTLPCYLLGHSMGSFIARCAATPAIWNKVIIMGTGGPNPASGAGLSMLKAAMKKNGERSYAPKIENMIFGAYNKHFADENEWNAWLTNIKEVRAAYAADKYCTFHFTVSALYDLVKLQSLCNGKKWFQNVSAKLPMLLVSGGEDPVGNYGKGVKKVYQSLKKNGKTVEMKLYPDCRHEILNDLCQEEVTEDILEFITA